MNRTFIKSFLVGGISLLLTNAQAQWVLVGPSGGPGFNVNDLQSFNSDLYAAGASSNGSKGVSKWDGTSWTSLARVYPKYNQYSLGVNSLIVYSNQIVAGGITDSIGGVYTGTSDVVTYNGSSWSKLGSNPPSIMQVNCMAVYNNELYVAGQGVNKWNGSSWTSVCSSSAITGQVNSMAVYNNELYVAGNFTKIGGQNMTTGKGFAKWNGTAWTVLPGLFDTLTVVGPYNVASAACMIPFQGELCVVGAMNTAGSTRVHGAAKWNGTAWSDMNGGIKGNGTLYYNCLTTDGSNLYVVGAIQRVNTTTTNDSINQSARWDGSKWHPMLPTASSYAFLSVEYHNSEIYSAYQSMVKWTGGFSGIEEVGQTGGLTAYPNPVSGLLHLTTTAKEQTHVMLYSPAGALLQTAQPDAFGNSTLDMSALPAGIYFARLNGSAGGRSLKIVKE